MASTREAVKLPSPEERRAGMRKLIETSLVALPPIHDSIEEFEIKIPVRDGWQSHTKIVRPKAHIQAKRPLIVSFFGGGFMVGDPDQLLSPARAFAETYGAVVALPSYRLMPDVKWPEPHKDGWDVVVWLSEHAEKELGADLDAGFIVGGCSAGASVAGACGGLAMYPDSEEARAAPKLAKPITGQHLLVPLVATPESVPEEYKSLFTAWEDNKDIQGLNTATLQMILNGLQITNYSSLWISPLAELVKREPVNKIPIYMEHCGLDPMRDDVTVLKQVLNSRGIPNKSQLFPEDIHGSWTVVDLPTKAKDPTFVEAQMEGMKWLLSRPTT
jgi:acetyl esterase/lipase